MLGNLHLHHIGVATKGITKELPFFETLGYQAISPLFEDPVQKIRGMFIAAAGQPTLELLENTESSGPLDACLKNGIKFYHFSYLVEDIHTTSTALAREHKAKIIVPVTQATYFSYVCFLMFPNMLLIELVQQ